MTDIYSVTHRSLETALQERISRFGPLSFRDFMETALYDSQHGYYAAAKAKIGSEGDFLTNVSTGSLFGRLLSRQIAEMWHRLGSPALFTLVEQGAADGTFALDLLEALEELEPQCSAATRYLIVEPSEALRRQQGEKTKGKFASKVAWSPSLAELPPFEGVHFSNELLDAFPVHRVRWTGSEWVERAVDWKDAFFFVDTPPSAALADLLRELPRDLPEGYETEVNLASIQWVESVASRLERGWILLIDYGYTRGEYYRSERTQGTLSAYVKHSRVDNPLQTPGEIDLTAHVDFSLVAKTALECGFQIEGFTDQHHFMTGLSQLYFRDTAEPNEKWRREVRAFKTLMHPNFLGASFHALCLRRGEITGVSPLAGFTFGDRVNRLAD